MISLFILHHFSSILNYWILSLVLSYLPLILIWFSTRIYLSHIFLCTIQWLKSLFWVTPSDSEYDAAFLAMCSFEYRIGKRSFLQVASRIFVVIPHLWIYLTSCLLVLLVSFCSFFVLASRSFWFRICNTISHKHNLLVASLELKINVDDLWGWSCWQVFSESAHHLCYFETFSSKVRVPSFHFSVVVFPPILRYSLQDHYFKNILPSSKFLHSINSWIMISKRSPWLVLQLCFTI